MGIHVWFSVQIDGIFMLTPLAEIEVIAGDAVTYGVVEQGDPEGEPVVLDAIVAAHKLIIGSAFKPETCSKFLSIRSEHWLNQAFGKRAFYSGFTINGIYAYELGSSYSKQGYHGLSYDKARIHEGDVLEMFAFQDSMGMDYYSYFRHDGKRAKVLDVKAGEQVTLQLEGLMYGYGGPMTRDDRIKHHLISAVEEAQLVTVDADTALMTPIPGAITSEDEGEATICFEEPGTYYVSSIGGEVRYNAQIVCPWLQVNVSS